MILFIGQPTMQRVPAAGGPAIALGNEGSVTGSDFQFPSFLRDGKRFLTTVITGEGRAIEMVFPDSRTRSVVLPNTSSAPIVAYADGRASLLYLRETRPGGTSL